MKRLPPVPNRDVTQFLCRKDATNLCKELRGCLSIWGEPLITIDLKNSQLFFLILLLDENNKQQIAREGEEGTGQGEGGEQHGTPNPKLRIGDKLSWSVEKQKEKTKEENRFKTLVMNGEIYNELNRELTRRTGIELSRSDFKVEFFKTVLYGNNRCDYAYLAPLSKLFREMFPHIWRFIVESKPKGNWKQFPVDMQRAESDFFIGTVARRLILEHPHVPIVPVHDAIMTTPRHVELVKCIALAEFRKLGYQPTLAIEEN